MFQTSGKFSVILQAPLDKSVVNVWFVNQPVLAVSSEKKTKKKNVWWRQRARVELTWGAAATTPTAGSSRRSAAGSWCCLWARPWGRAAARTPGGRPPDGTSPGPWAPRGRRCSSGWPRPRSASPPSVPSRSRLTGCPLQRGVSGHHDSASGGTRKRKLKHSWELNGTGAHYLPL